MGVNNRQRRAAKKRARGRTTAQPRPAGTSWDEPPLTAADVRQLLLDVLDGIEQDATAARRSR